MFVEVARGRYGTRITNLLANKKPILGILVATATFVAMSVESVDDYLVESITPQIVKAHEHEHVSLSETQTNHIHKNSIEESVRAYFTDIPVLIDIAWCESRFRHTSEDGTVLRGVVRADVGVMQINEYYHLKTAKQMNLNLHTLEENMAYARYLYETQGTRPWNASRHCWQKRPKS